MIPAAGAGLAELVDGGFGGAAVAVIGDAMLDRYLHGTVARISPEAPVPVLRLERTATNPGGAANVAANLAALGLSVHLACVTGDDEAGDELAVLLAQARIAFSRFTALGCCTTVKTRVVGGGQQMVRIDEEVAPGCHRDAGAMMAANMERLIPDRAAVLVLSDYAKGVLDPATTAAAIGRARSLGIPVVVDPKGRDWRKYAGSTSITPNIHELEMASGASAGDFPAQVAAARALIRDLGLSFLTLTRGDKGIACIDAQDCVCIPAEAREVFDVSGAGDTVAATLAAALACGRVPVEAVFLANCAAGTVVARRGTVPVERQDLVRRLIIDDVRGKIVSREHAVELVGAWRSRGERVVFTNGCFDLLHAGHVGVLEQARRQGSKLVVGLNSDDSIRRLKGSGRPVNTQAERAEVLAALAAVDLVVIFAEDTPLALIEALRPQVLAKGGDYTVATMVGAEQVRSWGGEAVILPLRPGCSTTGTIGRLRQDG